MTCGVPQGSVLGPLLWNIGYDWVLRGQNLPGVSVTCYADDTLVTARGKDYRLAAMLATAGTAHVVQRIRALGLEVALHKTEALCFHGPRFSPPPDAHITIGGVNIAVGDTMRYLGLVLDGRWKFEAHFRQLMPKVVAITGALKRIMPHIGGPGASCRRLYTNVVRSMALYGAPVWADALTSANIRLLRRPQRAMAVAMIRGYSTVSGEAACVIAGSVPWDLDARALASLYTWREEQRARGQRLAPAEIKGKRRLLDADSIRTWEARLEHPSAGLRTVEAIRPVLQRWLDRPHGTVSYRLTQILTGHGCFGWYLCRIAGSEPTQRCHHCDGCPEESAQHALAECPAWASQRAELTQVVGNDLSLPTLIRAMLDSDRSWKAVLAYCEETLKLKEEAEREREREAAQHLSLSLPPLRRPRRPGRRREAYARHLPP